MDNWLRHNNVIRVVAVVVGILLWVIVRLDLQNSSGPTQPTTVSQTYTNVGVQVVGLDEERYTLLSYEPARVSLTVVGTASALRRVDINDYRVVLNLTDIAAGEHQVSLTPEGFPNNVQVVLDPPNVTVTIDEKERKEVPVSIQTVGSPADGYTAGEAIAQPNRVNVTVISSEADRVAGVVGTIDIAGATASVKQQVKLVAIDQDGQELDVAVTPAVVDVEVPITSPFKTMPLQIALVGNTPAGYAVASFEQSASEVTVFAPQAFLNSLEFYDGLRIDLSQLTETTTFEFDIAPKQGVERVEPAKVTAKVTVVPAVVQTLPGVPVTLNGGSANYEYRIVDPTAGELDVPVEGAPGVIEKLSPRDVRAIVDVSNLAPGMYELPIDYSLPSFVETADGASSIVRVEVAPKSDAASADPAAPLDDGSVEGGDAVGPGEEPAAPSEPEAE
ncbi:CdaR family protein [Paenibacillus sp.]|uniref:CdaR family protein n=1 Tax=Paenibacillus sp. TaxID=58172 RepID=UPI002D2C6220|nr:CdaR family protein [Paenibacillus sp.]HZG86065.1 CdaR family protein [Paenibacillus sp.]